MHRAASFFNSWIVDPKFTTPSNQLLPMLSTTIHDTFNQGDTTAFSILLGVLVVVTMLVFLFLRAVQSFAIGPFGV